MSDPEDYLFLSLTPDEALVMTMGLLALVTDPTVPPSIRGGARNLSAKIKECVVVQKTGGITP